MVHSHQTAIVLVVVIFLFDNLREKRSEPLSKESDTACFTNFCGIMVENHCSNALSYSIPIKSRFASSVWAENRDHSIYKFKLFSYCITYIFFK